MFAETLAPENRSAGRPDSLTFIVVWREDRHALKRVRLGAPVLEIEEGDAAVVSSGDVARVQIEELRRGDRTGRPRISTAFTKVKTVVFRPMPSPRASAATSVNQGSLRRSRQA